MRKFLTVAAIVALFVLAKWGWEGVLKLLVGALVLGGVLGLMEEAGERSSNGGAGGSGYGGGGGAGYSGSGGDGGFGGDGGDGGE
ncbi:hypothetical protein AAH991_05945 [Microbispora sp. ZYX-F-249]|uniref:Uncharacterized protein n=1 Tax=Microbispora maris TaxID=3144104 RepID=A0ABV0AJA0_9ACTN